jgi:hypothetical protein
VVGHQNPLLPPDAALRAGGLPLQKMTSSYLFLKPYSCSAYEGATGTFLWTEKTGYQAPSAGFTPGLVPHCSAVSFSYPISLAGVLVRDNPAVAGHNSAAVDPVTKSVWQTARTVSCTAGT